MIFLLGKVCCRFFPFRTLSISCHFLLACNFLQRIHSADSLIGIPLYMALCFSLAAFRALSSFLTFAILIMICLGIDLFGFIFWGTFCASCTWIAVSFFWLGKFLALISSNKFSIPFYLSSSETTVM